MQCRCSRTGADLRARGSLQQTAYALKAIVRSTRSRFPPTWRNRPTWRLNLTRSPQPAPARTVVSGRSGSTMPPRALSSGTASAFARVDADRRHRLFPRRRGACAGPAARTPHHRHGRHTVCAVPGQVPLRRGAAGAWTARAAGRARPRRAMDRAAAAHRRPAISSSRTGSAPRSASGQDSRCRVLDDALELSRRVFAAYRDDVIVQPYVAGRNVRASFLAVSPEAGA